MNINKILRYTLMGICAAPLTVNAQVKLADKQTQKVNLGYEVEISEFLTTAAATTITAEELQRTSAVSLADALYGKLLGLTAIQNTGFKGEEGKGATFNIRGIQTRQGSTANFTDANDILILVDGVERPIDRLLVEEVESVTVLKDAAAVALFGHEGINGVLYVKTKRGKANSGNHVKAGYSHKFQFDPQFADMVSAFDYATALNIARKNDGLAPAYTADELAKFQDGSDPYVYPNINWKEQAFRNTAHESQAFVSMYGGSEKVQYYTQLNYTDARGLYNNTKQENWDSQLKYSKANIRANVDFRISESTKISASMLAMFMETNGLNNVSSNDAWWHLYKTPAIAFPVQTANGVWGGSQTFGDFNLLAKMQGTGFQKTHQRQVWANMMLDQDLSMFVKGLKFYIGASYDNCSNIYEQNIKGYQYGWNYYDAVGSLAETVMGTKEDKLRFSNWVNNQWRLGSMNVGFKYNTQFGNGDNLGLNANYNIKGELRDGQHHSWYRANWQLATHYDHANKLMADLVLAANGSNRSYPAKWAFSPTLGLGYIYANNTDEDAILNYGKVRASAGIQHTDFTPEAGMWLAPWNMSHGQFVHDTSFQSSWGAFLQAFPTEDFMQETAYKVNVGTDIRLMNSLDFTLDAFYQKHSNILVPANQKNSAVVGIQSAYDDKGEVSSYGVEAGLRYAKVFENGLNVYGGVMLTATKSKVDSWIENPAYKNLSVIGDAADAPRALVALGFFESEDDIANSPRQEFGQVKVGDIKYKDVNGDNVINQNDYVALDYGTSFPSLNYAVNLGVEYKGFGINATFQGAGNQMKNIRYVDGVWGALSNNRNLSAEYYNNCWDNAGSAALYPRLSTESVANNEQESTIWYRNAKWFKMRDFELYYKLPASVLSSLKINGAKIFLQGQNLLSWSSIKAMDAENLNTGYPVMKSVNLGLSVTF
ncbi:MAG: SusC/RagA family TonB-linked outer membrane protein [Bacteroidaceae bacterium]|nr:SusC/RagA family TonB-linked outer membrane protein [Bacteroidaceae bacterium]